MRLSITVTAAVIPSLCAVSGNTFRFWKTTKSDKLSSHTNDQYPTRPVNSLAIQQTEIDDSRITAETLGQIRFFLNELNESHAQTSERISKVIDRIGKIDHNVDGWKKEFENLESKLDKLLIGVEALRKDGLGQTDAPLSVPVPPPFPISCSGLVPPPPPPPPQMMTASVHLVASENSQRVAREKSPRGSKASSQPSFIDELKHIASSSSDSDEEQVGSKLLANIARRRGRKEWSEGENSVATHFPASGYECSDTESNRRDEVPEGSMVSDTM
jgi:hypothetical protein